MHWERLLTLPITKDVCIFCATRQHFASGRPAATLYRRSFRSNVPLRRPPAAAAAQQEADNEEDAGIGQPPSNQTRRGWATTSGPRDFTPKESKLGAAFQNVSHKPLIRKFAGGSNDQQPGSARDNGYQRAGYGIRQSSASQQVPREHESWATDHSSTQATYGSEEAFHNPAVKELRRKDAYSRQLGSQQISVSLASKHINKEVDNVWACPSCRYDNSVRNLQCRRCGVVGGEGWRCLHCRWSNPTENRTCANCNVSQERDGIRQKGHDALRAEWKHVRRREAPAIAQQQQQPGVRYTDPQADRSPDAYALARFKAAEARSVRIESTRDGGFVGLREDNPQTEQFYEGQPTIPSHMALGPNLEDGRRSQRPQNSERPDILKSRTRAKRLGLDVTPPPFQPSRDKQRKSKQFVSTMDDFDEDDSIRAERRVARKREREKAKLAQKDRSSPTPIYLPEFISISNLAGVLKVRVEDFMQKMRNLGFEESNNDHILDSETAGLVAAEFNFEPIVERDEDRDLLPQPPAKDKTILPSRSPVVTIMGHVDHGKTTILDYLRKSSVAASEHGGITQHIGAFSVPMPGGRLITFLDTPGHEAFLSMRQRGANVTDIIILVVAADDSVKPQTIEAIKHAQAAKVPMIVAVNKIDKEDSNVERVKQDLARYGVEIEDFGGDTQIVCVSGKTGQGMNELEEAAVALADILDMRSETDGQAEGWVLEATTKPGGKVATVLVRRGTLEPGDIIVAGTSWARVRSLRNEAGVVVGSAGPGTPVAIDGWREQPAAGDEVIQAPDEQKAKSVIQYRLEASERKKMSADVEAVNEARRIEQEKREQLEKAAELAVANPDAPAAHQVQDISATPSFQEVFFIVKADVSGSVEAVTNLVSAVGNSAVRPNILRSGVGPISEFDIDQADVAKGLIINFNTPIEGQMRRLAESKGVDIVDQSIIYRLVDDVKAKLSEKLPSVVTQRVLGEAEISQVFEINVKGRETVPIAGCKVRNGVVSRSSKIRVLRDKEIVFDGSLSSLKNVKKDVAEMRKGGECGIGFDNWTDFKAGDQVQAYEESVEKRTL